MVPNAYLQCFSAFTPLALLQLGGMSILADDKRGLQLIMSSKELPLRRDSKLTRQRSI